MFINAVNVENYFQTGLLLNVAGVKEVKFHDSFIVQHVI